MSSPGDCILRIHGKYILSGATTCTVLFGKISSQLDPQHFLGADNHRHQFCYLDHFQMWHILMSILAQEPWGSI